MRQRAGAVLIEEGKILLIHRIRIKEGVKREYYVLPGGGVEENENIIEASKREILEEIGIDINIISNEPVYVFEDDNGKHSYMLVEKVGGNIGTGQGPEFISDEYSNRGSYIVEMINISDIIKGKINLVPEPIKEVIINDMKKFTNIREISSKYLLYLKR